MVRCDWWSELGRRKDGMRNGTYDSFIVSFSHNGIKERENQLCNSDYHCTTSSLTIYNKKYTWKNVRT